MYTDIHSHVIWGVDDGAETKEETCRMLREAAAISPVKRRTAGRIWRRAIMIMVLASMAMILA